MNQKKQLPPAYLNVARAQKSVLLQVMGLGNMHNATSLAEFIEQGYESGYRHFAVDLSHCTGMDSTFMGTLVGLKSKVGDQGGWFCVLNVSDDNRKLLEMIGVWGLIPILNASISKDLETEVLLPHDDAARRMRRIRKAHQHLVAIDERNRERFGAFLDAVEQEMGPAIDPSAETVDPDTPMTLPEDDEPYITATDSERMRREAMQDISIEMPFLAPESDVEITTPDEETDGEAEETDER